MTDVEALILGWTILGGLVWVVARWLCRPAVPARTSGPDAPPDVEDPAATGTTGAAPTESSR